MTFIERALDRAGLGHVLPARRRGEPIMLPDDIDLLLLGALADAVRAAEVGAVARVHPEASAGVRWICTGRTEGRKDSFFKNSVLPSFRPSCEINLLRSVAVARVTGPHGVAIGVDWGDCGLEVAQVALGFGASDLTGPITTKSGGLIAAGDLRKVKGQGMVAASALKRREIAALIANAGRRCEFTDEAAGNEAAHA
jgi:hypothetical protein